jgi:hypothetical protein
MGIWRAVNVGQLHGFCPASNNSLLRQGRACLEWLGTQPLESVLAMGDPGNYWKGGGGSDSGGSKALLPNTLNL